MAEMADPLSLEEFSSFAARMSAAMAKYGGVDREGAMKVVRDLLLPGEQPQPQQQWQAQDLGLYAEGFRAPYLGHFTTSLLGIFDEIVKAPGTRLHSSIPPILQSSGFGKTRSLLELSKSGVFVFYINCQDQGRLGYPLRSPEADSLFLENDKHALGLIRAVLEQLREFLGNRAETLAKKEKELEEKEKELEEKEEKWKELEEKLPKKSKKAERRRSKLEAEMEAIRSGKSVLESEVGSLSMSGSVPWTDDQVLLDRKQKSRVAKRWMKKWEKTRTAEVEDVNQAFANLEQLGRLRRGNQSLKVLFVFDDCSCLFRDRSGLTSGYFIQRSFEFLPGGLMGAMVDTKADLAPPAYQDPSLRTLKDPGLKIMKERKDPARPICEIETIHRPDLSEYLGQLELPREVLYTVGRPLWYALMRNEGTTAAKKLAKLEDIAVRKLLGGVSGAQVSDVMAGKVKLEAAMSVLSACLSLAVVPQSRLASTLVGSYTSPLVEVSSDRNSVLIMDAWDPVLSAAGKGVFRSAEFRLAALDHLLKASEDFLIDEGKNGELVCRYILLRAMIRAEKDGTATVKAFLTELVGQEDADKMDDLGALKDYVLNFDSFVPLTCTPLLGHLKEAYLLRKALICKSQQSHFDALVVVKGPKPENAVSMIGFQFNSHEGSDSMDPLAAGFPDFESFATVLLQVHPRSKPSCEYECVSREQGKSPSVNPKRGQLKLVYGLTSKEASYVLDGLEAVSFLTDQQEAKEREMLERLLACRRLDKYKRLKYFKHLNCIVEGTQEEADDGVYALLGPKKTGKKRKHSAGGE